MKLGNTLSITVFPTACIMGAMSRGMSNVLIFMLVFACSFCIVLCIAKNKCIARFTRGVSHDWLVDESSKFKLTLPTISW